MDEFLQCVREAQHRECAVRHLVYILQHNEYTSGYDGLCQTTRLADRLLEARATFHLELVSLRRIPRPGQVWVTLPCPVCQQKDCADAPELAIHVTLKLIEGSV